MGRGGHNSFRGQRFFSPAGGWGSVGAFPATRRERENVVVI